MKYVPAIFLFIFFISSCSKKNGDGAGPLPIDKADSLGAGWSKLTSLPAEEFRDVFFTDISNGYAVSNNGIYKSNNSGGNWSKIYTGPNFQNIAAANGSRACFSDFSSTMLNTQDGINLSPAAYPVPVSGTPTFVDAFYADINTCFAASLRYCWKSTNGGISFDTVFNFQTSSNYMSLFFLNSSVGWIVRAEGIYKSSTGGSLWTLQKSFTGAFGGIDFVDANTGYAIIADNGNNPVVYKTINGGSSYNLVFTPPVGSNICDIDFIDASTGYISVTNRIYKTSDGGITWNTVAVLGSGSFYEIHFVDANHGWACTTTGALLKFN